MRLAVRLRAALVAAPLCLGAPAALAATPEEDPDPWQAMNREIFAFNEALDLWFLEPVATGYDYVVPDAVQEMVRSFTTNLGTPAVMMNDLLQGKPDQAAEDLARMAINSSFGLAGLVDVAAAAGVEENEEDLGQTLAVWGVPSGPYLVLPLLGPSSPRDAVGQIGDAAATVHGFFVPTPVSVGIGALELLNLRAALLDDIRDARAAAFDYYVFARNLYVQYRRNLVEDRAPGADAVASEEDDLYDTGDEDDLYFFDDEDPDDLYDPDDGADDPPAADGGEPDES